MFDLWCVPSVRLSLLFDKVSPEIIQIDQTEGQNKTGQFQRLTLILNYGA